MAPMSLPENFLNIINSSSSGARIHADKNHIKTLMEMGFSKAMCKAALKKNRNNIDRSLDQLLTNPDQFIGVDNSNDSS
jgi:uncharacterized UBP type Zn finger protein